MPLNPDSIKQSSTQFMHGHKNELVYTVTYYKSADAPAIDEPPPDYFFPTKLIGDTYVHHPVGEAVQIWYRDISYIWTPCASGQEHPYLRYSYKNLPYVLNVRANGFATWVQKATKSGYEAQKAREVCR